MANKNSLGKIKVERETFELGKKKKVPWKHSFS